MTLVATLKALLPGVLFVLLGVIALAAARRKDRPAPLAGNQLDGLAGPLLIAGGVVLIVLNLLHFE